MGGDEFRRLVHRVEKLIRSNALDRALLAAEYLVTRWPEEAVCYCARGRVRLAMGEPDQAIQDADRALAMDAGCGKAHIARGDILCALGRLGDALESYGRAAALEPDCVEAYVGKGNALRAQKRYAEALRCYDRAIALDPENGDAHDAKGVALRMLKRFDEALACCRRAVTLSPADARVYGHRAALYAEMGLKEAALEDYLRCIALDPQNLSAHAEMLALDKDRLLVGARDTDLKRAVYEFGKGSDARNAWPAQERPADAAPPYDRIARFHADSRSGDIWDASETFRNGFDRFLADQVAPCAESPRLHVLRRGSPHAPASAYDGGAAPCGGYFLQHGRTGAAVDPGPGFIADFMDAGFAFSQVGSVFISNAQEGQCGGLASILALLHAYNEGVGRDVRAAVAKDAALGRFPDLDGRTEREILEALSAEYERRFSEQRKRVDVYLSLGAFRTHAPLLAAGDPCGCRAHVLEAGHPPVELGDGVRVLPIPAWRAGGDCGQGALGLVWEFEQSALVYTGDTAYTPRIGREYAEIRGRLRSPDKPVALLARLGGSGKTEKDVSEGQLESGEAFRGDCLGRNGVIALADALRPGLVILSGMGEELCGQRARLAGLFGDVFGDCGIRFLPADAGFCINGALEVWAVDRVDYSQGRAFPVLVRRFVPYASVRAEEEGAHILYYNAGTRADVDGLMSQALQGRRDGRKDPLPHEAVLLAD